MMITLQELPIVHYTSKSVLKFVASDSMKHNILITFSTGQYIVHVNNHFHFNICNKST